MNQIFLSTLSVSFPLQLQVRLTGGEPLLRKDIANIITKISANPSINSVGITTNAITLSRQLPALTKAGLTHANISLDTLIDEKYVVSIYTFFYSLFLRTLDPFGIDIDSFDILNPSTHPLHSIYYLSSSSK